MRKTTLRLLAALLVLAVLPVLGSKGNCDPEPVCTPSQEICNDLDDDCDGETDEGLTCLSPEEERDLLLGRIDAERAVLQGEPANCPARQRREVAFADLYQLMQDHYGMDRMQVDATYRTLADYVFAELVYEESPTCCWSNTTSEMYQIIMLYAQDEMAAAEQQGQCVEPPVFKRLVDGGDGYVRYEEFAAELGDLDDAWEPWTPDEACPNPQGDTDTEADFIGTAWCDLAYDDE